MVTVRDGVADLIVGAGTEAEAIAMARRYFERRGWQTGEAEVVGSFRPKVGIMGYRAWRVRLEVERPEVTV